MHFTYYYNCIRKNSLRQWSSTLLWNRTNLAWHCPSALDQVSSSCLREDGWKKFAIRLLYTVWPSWRGWGSARVIPHRMWAFTQLYSITLCPHLTGRKSWYLSDWSHVLISAYHSQIGVVIGPKRAGRKDEWHSAVTIPDIPTSIHRCRVQVLQIVEPLHSTVLKVLREWGNVFPGSEGPLLFLNLAFWPTKADICDYF